MTHSKDSSSSRSSSSSSSSSDERKKEDVAPRCVLDRSLVNADTFPMMKNVGLSIYAPACSKNRGAFVLHPSDGQTYGCLEFPTDLLATVGIQDHPLFEVKTVEDITKRYADGNLTAANAVDILDFLVDNVYQSTPVVQDTPYACDVSGLVTLECANDKKQKTPVIRAVTMAGVFTPALWATGGKELSFQEASNFYTSEDFAQMKQLGLNTVQIPIPVKMFSKVHKEKAEWQGLLTDVLHQVRKADLEVILILEQGTSPAEDVASPVQAAAVFAQDYNDKHGGPIITAMTLPSLDSALLEAATKAVPDLDVWIPTKEGDFTKLQYFPSAAGVSLSLSHTVTVADVASSSSAQDRSKLFYHENMACIARAPLEFSACYQDMPVTVASGFDLAVDNCHLEGIADDTFQDYGQCRRFNETIESPWWKDHRYSFAARQLFAYEQGKGWVFAAWKLWGSDPNPGVLDTPAKLLSFQEVVAAGIMPSLFNLDEPIQYPLDGSAKVGLACLNPPENDFAMGDATFPPTPAPPPSCGNGWWNFETQVCDYWVPPTPAPIAPCPVVCGDKETTDFALDSVMLSESLLGGARPMSHRAVAAQAFLSGSVLSLIGAFVVYRVVAGRSYKRNGYEQVGTNENETNYQGA